METSLSPRDMKQIAIDQLHRIYGHCVEAHDGIRDGKWTLEDWNDVDHQPPVATVDDLIMVSFVGISSATALCERLGLLSPEETIAIDKEYRDQRPDIFWPMIRRGPPFVISKSPPAAASSPDDPTVRV